MIHLGIGLLERPGQKRERERNKYTSGDVTQHACISRQIAYSK